MAANSTSGRKKLPPEVARSEPVRLLFTQGQAEDLKTIADAWGVGMATVCFAFVAKELAEIRKMQLNLGCLGIEFAATLRLLEAEALRQPEVGPK